MEVNYYSAVITFNDELAQVAIIDAGMKHPQHVYTSPSTGLGPHVATSWQIAGRNIHVWASYPTAVSGSVVVSVMVVGTNVGGAT